MLLLRLLILTAADDPFVPPMPFNDPALTGNPHVTVIVTAHGGHCGYLDAAPGEEGIQTTPESALTRAAQ